MIEDEERSCENCEHVNVINEEEPCASCYKYSNWETRFADRLLAHLIFNKGEDIENNKTI